MIPVTYGYARISKSDDDAKNLETQLRLLAHHGIREDLIHTDVASGRTMDRPGWRDLMGPVQPGDTIVVAFLDRFSRNFEEGVRIQAELTARDIGIVALRENIDTSDGSAAAKFFRRSFRPWLRPACLSGFSSCRWRASSAPGRPDHLRRHLLIFPCMHLVNTLQRTLKDDHCRRKGSTLTRSIPGLYDGPCGLTPRNTCCQENIDQVNIWATESAGWRYPVLVRSRPPRCAPREARKVPPTAVVARIATTA